MDIHRVSPAAALPAAASAAVTSAAVTPSRMPKPGSLTATSASSQPALSPIPHLLEHIGLPVERDYIMAARALLGLGLPVTYQSVIELHTALSTAVQSAALKNWDQAEADLVALMKANGLPLTPAAINLTVTHLIPALPVFNRLLNRLRSLGSLTTDFESGLPPELAARLQDALALLEGSILQGDESPAQIAEQLRRALALWGRSLENELAAFFTAAEMQSSGAAQSNPLSGSLLVLAQLRSALPGGLPEAQARALGEEIDQFLDTARASQFFNAPTFLATEPASTGAERQANPQAQSLLPMPAALVFILPYLCPRSDHPALRDEQPLRSAELRISYNSEEDQEGGAALNQFHLVFQIEIGEQAFVGVDLSVVEKRVGVTFTLPDQILCNQAVCELPGLQQALKSLGFDLQSSQAVFSTAAVENTASVPTPLAAGPASSQVSINGIDHRIAPYRASYND